MKKKTVLMALLVSVLLFNLSACSIGNKVGAGEKPDKALLSESRENINPYLEYVGSYTDRSCSIQLPSNLYNNLKSIEFMGVKGEIDYGTVYVKKEDPLTFGEMTVKYVKYCSWSSQKGFSEEDYQEFANKLNDYFRAEARTKSRQYVNGNTYWYYWEDSDTGLSVSFGHNLFGYSPNGNVEIIWAYEFCEGHDFYAGVD